MSDDKRNLLQEAMVLQTDEETKAFVESLSSEERQELHLQIEQIKIEQIIREVFEEE